MDSSVSALTRIPEAKLPEHGPIKKMPAGSLERRVARLERKLAQLAATHHAELEGNRRSIAEIQRTVDSSVTGLRGLLQTISSSTELVFGPLKSQMEKASGNITQLLKEHATLDKQVTQLTMLTAVSMQAMGMPIRIQGLDGPLASMAGGAKEAEAGGQ